MIRGLKLDPLGLPQRQLRRQWSGFCYRSQFAAEAPTRTPGVLPKLVWLNTVETELLPSPDSSLNSQGARRYVDLKMTVRRPTCMLGGSQAGPQGVGAGWTEIGPRARKLQTDGSP